MKYFILVIILLLGLYGFPSCHANAEELSSNNNFEWLSKSDDGKELSLYSDSICRIVNSLIKSRIEDADQKNIILNEVDFRFSSNLGADGVLVHSVYHPYQYSVSYCDVIEATDNVYWNVDYKKNNWLYHFILSKELISQSSSYKISNEWYLSDFYVGNMEQVKRSRYMLLHPDTVVNNCHRLIENDFNNKNIVFLRTKIGNEMNEGYIIFVDEKANYIYCPYFYCISPSERINEDTSDEKTKQIEELQRTFYNNLSSENTTELKRMYQYNMIVFIINFVSQYIQ